MADSRESLAIGQAYDQLMALRCCATCGWMSLGLSDLQTGYGDCHGRLPVMRITVALQGAELGDDDRQAIWPEVPLEIVCGSWKPGEDAKVGKGEIVVRRETREASRALRHFQIVCEAAFNREQAEKEALD